LYHSDEFPNELNKMSVIQPEGNVGEDFDPVQNYAAQKVNTELALLGIEMLNLRIIRPFSIVSHEQRPPWPLAKLIVDAITGATLNVYGDGRRGIVYTHANDLASFINSYNLFDQEVAYKLTSRIINFCRTQNYLPEEFLVRKVIDKTESESTMVHQMTFDMFPYMMKTPQIRNMAKIWRPIIPIEMIIEEYIEKINPMDIYDPVEVTGVEYIQDNFLQISGTAEPLGVVSVALGTGQHMVGDVTEDGSWAVQTDIGIYFEEDTTAIVYATTKDGLQYDTTTFTVPASPLPPDVNP
jgi:hypothetical protein